MPKNSKLREQKILLVGAGKMGAALLSGWLDSGLDASQFNVLEPNPSTPLKDMGVSLAPPKGAVDILVLAIKPQMLDEVAPSLAKYVSRETLLLSILAGATQKQIGEALASENIIRAMPNTPAAIGQGIAALYAAPAVSAAQKEFAQTLLAAVGGSLWLESEAQIDAATAISGSGPSYVFYLAEVMAANGERLGLEKEVAEKLAYQTIIGASQMLAGDVAPARLRENVTSPGGTTEAALEILMVELPDIMKRAINAAMQRAKDLSN